MEELQGTFELNKIGWYIPLLVEENTWLNEKQSPADLAKFGKTYSVVFKGDAQSYLWTAKTAPEANKSYWGHLQATSGRSIRFKTDKQEDAPQANQSPSQGSYEGHSDKEDGIARSVALKAAVEYAVGNGDPAIEVLELADTYVTWLKNDSGTLPATVPTSRATTSNEVPPAPAAASGYARAKQARAQLEEPLPTEPEDLLGWIQEGEQDDN